MRAVNNLTRGDFVGAVSSNVMAVVLIAVLAIAWVLWVIRRMRGQHVPMLSMNGAVGMAMIAAFLVFGLVRKLTFGS